MPGKGRKVSWHYYKATTDCKHWMIILSNKMATITLYAGKINQMPGLINEVKKSVVDYKSELSALRKKTLNINRSVCNWMK